MKVSVNWLRKFTALDLALDDLIEKIGAQLGAVDEVIDLGKKYRGATIAKVVSCEKHPNADKLSVCIVDVGKAKQVQVVCGAPNVKAGQMVVWLPPGATVPSTYDKDPFVLQAREIRGVLSHGMIASAKELALGDDHSGILVLDEEYKPGTSFAQAYGLDDTIIDIENKMFTHRPDLFGMLGVAREVAGIQHKTFKSPSWYRKDADLHNDGRKNVLKLEIKNDLPRLVPRFTAIVIKDVKVQESPAWLKARLASVGSNSINNIVDVTNYLMLETAQPLHAYDYDKVKSGVLGVREAKEGEELTLLGGKSLKLQKGSIVITDGERPIGLGGIKGGTDTEIDQNTRNIILECANFDMNTIRRTAMSYGLFTDASTRFTKNQSPLQTRAVLLKAVEAIKQAAGGRVASRIIDDKNFSASRGSIGVSAEFINKRLGFNLTPQAMAKFLQNVEFAVKIQGQRLEIKPPFWRTDIEVSEDIVEEIGRLYGYDKLPITLPDRSVAPATPDELLSLKTQIRDILAAAGANEVLTYSFVHGNLMDKAGQDKSKAYKLANALSPDLHYYRISLTPGLLNKIYSNIRLGFEEFVLFEIGKSHVKGVMDKDGLPKELERLSLVLVSKNQKSGSPYYAAKHFFDYLIDELGISGIEFKKLNPKKKYGTLPYYDPNRGADIEVDGRMIGRIGEFTPSVKAAFKLPKYSAGFDVHTDELLKLASPPDYQPLNRYPELEQDFNLRTEARLPYSELTRFLRQQLEVQSKNHGYQFELRPQDIYQRENDKEHKQTTWRIILWHRERTLTTAETNDLLDKVATIAKKELNAERI